MRRMMDRMWSIAGSIAARLKSPCCQPSISRANRTTQIKLTTTKVPARPATDRYRRLPVSSPSPDLVRHCPSSEALCVIQSSTVPRCSWKKSSIPALSPATSCAMLSVQKSAFCTNILALLTRKVPSPTMISATIRIMPNRIPPAINPFCPDLFLALSRRSALKAVSRRWQKRCSGTTIKSATSSGRKYGSKYFKASKTDTDVRIYNITL